MKRPLSLQATVKIKAAAGTQQRRRFAIVAYTGSALDLPNYDQLLYIDLDGLYWNSGRRPCLYDHEPDKENLVGQLDNIRIHAGQLLVDGFFLRSTSIGREVQAIAEEGYEWQASVWTIGSAGSTRASGSPSRMAAGPLSTPNGTTSRRTSPRWNMTSNRT